MILAYIDESGDTGHNLSDRQLPVFVLGALYYIRKFEENGLGFRVSVHHQETFPIIEKICESLKEHSRGQDIINWVESNLVGQKKERLPPKEGAVS